MSTIAKYTAFENLTRIEMEKTVNFVVVQGESDAPIYESVITSILPEEEIGCRAGRHLSAAWREHS